MPNIRRTLMINVTLGVILLGLGLGLSSTRGQRRLMKEFRRIEKQSSTVNPANAVSSCSALVAVFFAWRSFTGYRRRCQG